MLHISCDIHTHTVFSRHAYSTVEENVRAAAELRFELLGVTDHFSPMVHPEPVTGVDLRDFQEFLNFEVWPETWHGVRLMHGCEADIVDLEGHLFGWDLPIERNLGGPAGDTTQTLQQAVFDGCDYVIASVHSHPWAAGASREQLTQMYVRALENPKVLVLGHVGRSGLDFDIDEVAQAARDLGKLIEINESSLYGRQDSSERCLHIAQRCRAAGCMVATGSDAHISCDVARLDRARALLEEAGIPPRLVATRDAETFLKVWERAVA
jgi:putative hydrolase